MNRTIRHVMRVEKIKRDIIKDKCKLNEQNKEHNAYHPTSVKEWRQNRLKTESKTRLQVLCATTTQQSKQA